MVNGKLRTALFSEILRCARALPALTQDDIRESAVLDRDDWKNPSLVTLSGAAKALTSRAVEWVLRASVSHTNSFAVFYPTFAFCTRFLHSAGLQPFSVEMTRMSLVFRDPSTRFAPSGYMVGGRARSGRTNGERAPLFRHSFRMTPSPEGEGKELGEPRRRHGARGVPKKI